MPLEACLACGAVGGDLLLDWPTMPVHCNRLYDDRAEALATPRGAIELVRCPSCATVYNRAFEPALVAYEPGYDNPLDHSPSFAAWQDEHAAKLVDSHGLAGGTVLEIGCGRGGFARALLAAGVTRVVAFEPAWDPAWPAPEGLTVLPMPFAAGEVPAAPDLVVCRHVLEHLTAPGELLEALAALPCPLVVEVPAGERIFRPEGIWDVIYEHCAHYDPVAITGLLQRAGFGVQRVEHAFGDQFLVATGIPGETRRIEPPSAISTARFEDPLRPVEEVASAGRWLVWGIGSKGVTLLNRLREGTAAGAVDVNPDKRARYVPGSGERILGLQDLPGHEADSVLVMNPMYASEIEASLRSIGIDWRVVPIDTLLAGEE